MVHEKARSGDPDFDDKVPVGRHAGKTVTAGDGREVLLTEANGPVNLDGTHANLDDPAGDAADNRPAPGEVATKDSEVQTYGPEDAPSEHLGEAGSQAEAEKLAADTEPAAEQADKEEAPTPVDQGAAPAPAKRSRAAK